MKTAKKILSGFILLLLFGGAGVSQDGKYLKTFRISFISSSEERALSPSWFEGLRKSFLQDEKLSAVLRENGFDKISILSVDGVNDLIQRMDHNEFHLVFASPMAYVNQTGDYMVMLQLRSNADFFDPRGNGVTQKGAVFVNNRSPLFAKNDLSEKEIKDYISSQTVAFISASSAVGYIAPRVKMMRDFNVREPGAYVFCDYSEEVVKYVISGIVDVGCCEESAIDEVLKNAKLQNKKNKILKIIIETEPVPTAPIVIAANFHPSAESEAPSRLGVVVRKSIKEYIRTTKKGLRVEHSADKHFERLRELVKFVSECSSGF